MHRLQISAHGEPAEVVELEALGERGPGEEEVLVAMEAAPINPSDFMLVRGEYRIRPSFPSPIGSEGVGRVAETGARVDPALRGRRVLIVPNHEQGTWADQVVAPVRNVVPVSEEADPVQLSMIGVNGVTAYLLLSRYVGLMPGDWIGQTAGNSAMGQCIVQLARLAGVRTLSLVRRPQAAEQVRRAGGDRVVVLGDEARAAIERALAGRELKLVLDAIGGKPVGELVSRLRDGGSLVSYGVRDGAFPAFSPYDLIFRGLTLSGFSVRRWMRTSPREEIEEIYLRLAELVAAGSLAVALDGVYPLASFAEAFAHSLRADRRGKTVFELGGRPRP